MSPKILSQRHKDVRLTHVEPVPLEQRWCVIVPIFIESRDSLGSFETQLHALYISMIFNKLGNPERWAGMPDRIRPIQDDQVKSK